MALSRQPLSFDWTQVGSRYCYDVEVYYRPPCASNIVIQLYPCQKFYVGLNLHFILNFQTIHQVQLPSRASPLSFDRAQVGSRYCYDVEVYYRPPPCPSNLVIQLYPCQKFYVGLNLYFIVHQIIANQGEWPSRASPLSFDWTQVRSRYCYEVEVYYRPPPCASNLVIQLYPCQKFYVGLNLYFIVHQIIANHVEWTSLAGHPSFDPARVESWDC